MQFPQRVIEAASRVLQERYVDGIELSDYRTLRRFREELCHITGQNPYLAYKIESIRELIKANGWSNGSKVIPYSFSKSAQKKTSNRNNDVPADSALIQELERYRNDYCVWFIKRYGNSFKTYWKTLKTIFNDASKNGIVDKTFDLNDLRRIRNDLFALPKYRPEFFSERETYLFALDRFIDFWITFFPDNAPEDVNPKDDASVEEEEEPERPEIDPKIKSMLLQDFESRRDDYYQWFVDHYSDSFNDYWRKLKTVVDDAIEFGILNDFLNGDALEKIETELLLLPKYQRNAFSSKWIYSRAVKRFIQFWDDQSTHKAGTDAKEQGASFDTYKEDFCRWLTRQGYSQVTSNDYWEVLRGAIVDAIAFGFIKDSFDRNDLNKIKTDLLSLPEYQAEVFHSRADCLFALKRFTEFLNERSVDSWKDNFSYDSGKSENSEEDESANEEDVENDEEGLSLAEFKDDFCSWLENHGFSESSRDLYWNCFINIANDAFERGIITEPIDDAELRKIKKILLALPEYQEDVYPARYDCLNALGYFIQFWDEDPFEDDEEEAEFTDTDSFDEDDHNEQASQINERHSKKSHSRNIKNLSFNDLKIDFYFWLQEQDHSLTSCNLYWDSLIGVLTEANKKELISKPVDVEVLKKLKENLSSLPQHEDNVFTSRSNEIKALDYFIEFWNDCSNNKQANSETVTETTIEPPDEDRHTAHKTSQEAGSFFQKYKDGFFNWLVNRGFSPSACELYRNSFEIFINEAFRQKLIADSFNIEDIGRIGTTLLSLPQYQFDVFPHRTNCIYALKYFVKFLKSNSFKQSDDKRSEDENTKDLLVPNMKMDETPSEDDILPFESYRDDFVQWLKRGGFSPSASKLLGSYLEEIIDAAVKHNIIVDSFDVDDLNRIEAELFALPKYQANVFPWRNSYMNALRKFIDFWNEDSDEETSDEAKQVENDDIENETSEKTCSVKFYKWDFSSDLEPFKLEIEKRTVEVSGGWKGLYVAVFEQCNSTYKRLFRKFYNRELSDYQNGVRRLPTFFINKPVGGVYVSLSDGKYVNINLTPDMFIDSLKRLLSTCVIYPKDVRAFFHKKVQEETATSIVLDSVKEEVRKEINKADASLDKKTQGRGADIREKFVEWLGKNIPSKETVEVYQAVLPDLEKFCKKQADPAFVLFETLDSKIIGQFVRRERKTFRTTIPPYAFSILNLYKRFLDEHAIPPQLDSKSKVKADKEREETSVNHDTDTIIVSSTPSDTEPLRRDTSFSFSKEEKQIATAILHKYFGHGFNIHSEYDLNRFRELWNRLSRKLKIDDFSNKKIVSMIVSAGNLFEGRVYTISSKAWNFITESLKKAFNEGLSIVYMSTFFEKNKKELNQLSCYNYRFLGYIVHKYAMKNFVGYAYKDGRIVRTPEDDENQTIKKEILRIWGDRTDVNIYWLKDQLQYVPLMIIERVLRREDCFQSHGNVWRRKDIDSEIVVTNRQKDCSESLIIPYELHPKARGEIGRSSNAILNYDSSSTDGSIEKPTVEIIRQNETKVGENTGELLYRFNTATQLGYTRPTRVILKNGEVFIPNGWADLYFRVVKYLYQNNTGVLRKIQQEKAEKGIIVDFLDLAGYKSCSKKSYHARIKQIDVDFYVNTNHGATEICTKIGNWINLCGEDQSSIKIYYVRTDRKNISSTTTKQEASLSVRSEITRKESLLPGNSDKESYIRLEEALRSSGLYGMSANDLERRLHWNTSTIKSALANSPNVVQLKNDQYVHADCFVDLDDAEEILEKILQRHFKQFDGYSNNQLLYSAASVELSMFLNDNDCNNLESVVALARLFFEKRKPENPYHFSRGHIFIRQPDYPCTLQGLLIHLARSNGGLLSASDAEEYLKKRLLSTANLDQSLQIKNSASFFMYDADSYLLGESIGIDQKWKNEINQRLDSLFKEANVAYIVPRDIRDSWFSALPELPLGRPWTRLFLQDLLFKHPEIGFRSIDSGLQNQKNDVIAAAIVPRNSELNNFADVVTLFMQERHHLPVKMRKEELRQELLEAGMLRGNELIYAMHKALNDYRFAWTNVDQTDPTVLIRGGF